MDGSVVTFVIAILIAWEMGRLTVQPQSNDLTSEKTLINISEDLY